MSLPLMGTVLETAMLFTANGYLKRRLREEQGLHPDAELPMPYVLLAGAGTGFCVAWVLTPIELVKCRMQVSGQPMQPIEGGGAVPAVVVAVAVAVPAVVVPLPLPLAVVPPWGWMG